jgi:hypothetical protein
MPNAAHFNGNTRSGRWRVSLGHALGESEMLNLLYIAGSFAKTRCPWFLSPSNKTLATVPFPPGMVGRFLEARISWSTRKAGLSDG